MGNVVKKGSFITLVWIINFSAILMFAAAPLVTGIVDRMSDAPDERVVHLTMAGFDPVEIRTTAGEMIELTLKNSENITHHFASDELGFDYLVDPRSTQTIQLVIDEPGEYLIFCDVCCGGKTNPSMQGKIIVS